jgi:hypothetical protein
MILVPAASLSYYMQIQAYEITNLTTEQISENVQITIYLLVTGLGV